MKQSRLSRPLPPLTLLSRLLPLLLIPLLLASCSEKGTDAPHPATLYDICDVASDNGAARFSLYLPDSDEPVILEDPAATVGDIPEGTSVVASYIPLSGLPHVSGPVLLRGISRINNFTLLKAKEPEDLDGWDADPVNLMSIWRGGKKIYMRLRLTYSAQPRRFSLVVDPSTADDPVPTAYLYNARPSGAPDFERQYYSAFDISSLWDSPDILGLRVIVSNAADSSRSEFTFMK